MLNMPMSTIRAAAQACKLLTFVPKGAPAQVQVAQGGERAQRAHCAIAHARAARHRQLLQPLQRLQRKHPRVADLQRDAMAA